MKAYQILGWFGLLAGMTFSSCYKDLGNYDYHEINEVTIGREGFDDTTYILKSFVDTLRIMPRIENSILQHPDNYEYKWVAVGDQFKLGGTWEMGNEKNLVYPLNLPEQDYGIYLHVKDKTTNVVTTRSTVLSLKTVFAEGWLLLGENDSEEVQLDMITMIGNDTIVMKDILKESGLPVLRKPTHLFIRSRDFSHPGEIQLGTEEGTYKLDLDQLRPIENAHLKYSFFDISSAGTCVLQDANKLYSFMYEMIDGRLYYDNDRYGGYARIGNPTNHYKGDYELFEIGDKIGYNLSSSGMTLSAIVAYDETNRRFVFQGGGMSASSGYCDSLVDRYSSAADLSFSWKTGLDFVTTINSRKVGLSNFTILKAPGASSPADYYLYAYNITNTGLGVSYDKKFKKQLTKLTEIDKAEFYASSIANSVIFYTVEGRLYGYNYNTDKLKMLLDFAGENMKETPEVITTLWYDRDPWGGSEDIFYLGLYAPNKPISTGGRLVGYRVKDNPDDMIIEEIPGSCQDGLCRITSMGWKSN